MENDQLIIEAQAGSMEALKKVFEENKKRMYFLAFQYTKNAEDAEDILQEIFIKAFHHLEKFQPQNGTPFSAWLYRIGINCSIDFLRRNKQKRENIHENTPLENIKGDDGFSNPEWARQKSEAQEKMEIFLGKLSPRQRMIFILRHYQELTTKEIAEYLNCTEGSIKKQLFRAIATLKKSFKPLLKEDSHGV
ncbi:MAG: RNA polymerase sigma factor [Candidatus Aminicenantes bacterium]|nr:RNA polymerase sigma factor [Candidatus Aminicenantes bacterium]